MHDAYTKMPFPAIPLDPEYMSDLSTTFFTSTATRLEKTTAAQKMEKKEGAESFDRSRFRLSSSSWRFPSTHSIPSIKTKPPKLDIAC
jgi:hypothetical protein